MNPTGSRPVTEYTDIEGTIFNEGRSFSFTVHTYDMQLILAPISY